MVDVRPEHALRVGPYEIIERIGSGGMAEVYVAHQPTHAGTTQRVAIKRILPQLAKDQRFVAMFCDEARICAALSHPNIVQVLDFGEDSGELFMAMEYVEGVSCAKLLRAVAARGQRFPVPTALFIALEVLRALDYAHLARDEHGRALGIVHRDVSPGNIIIGRAGEVKLTDFGIVRSEFVARRTYPGELKGKIGYMAPEQVIGADVDRRTDLFALGIVLSEMLVARPLFPGPSEMEILTRIYEANVDVLDQYGEHIPQPLMYVLKRALLRDRDKRYQSALEFAAALEDVASELELVVDDRALVPWLTGLGVLPSRSGLRQAARREARPPMGAERQVPAVRSLLQQPLVPRGSLPPTGPQGHRSSDALPREPGYWLQTRHGPVGPLSVARLAEQVATGRVERGAAVRRDSGEAQPVESLTALTHLFGGPEYVFRQEQPADVTWSQPLERWRLPAVLYRLTLRRDTGLLIARRGSQEKRVFFADGSPCWISSTRPDELLGGYLVRAGAVTAQGLDRALAAMSDGSGRRLGEILLMQGQLETSELLRHLVAQLRERFVELGGWERGQLMFLRGAACRSPLPQDAGAELVTQLIRVQYGDVEVQRLLSDVMLAPLARSASQVGLVERLGIDETEAQVLEMAPGSLRMTELCVRAEARGISGETVRRAVLVGLSSGLIVSPAW